MPVAFPTAPVLYGGCARGCRGRVKARNGGFRPGQYMPAGAQVVQDMQDLGRMMPADVKTAGGKSFTKASLGLCRIVPLYYCSSTLYHNH